MLSLFVAYLKLMRIHNCLITLFSVFAASFVATQSFVFRYPVLMGALAASFIMGGGNALNDYFDCEIDRSNKPNRPIPSGRITHRNALIFALLLFLIGLGLSFSLRILAASIALVNTCLLVIYARHSKRMAFGANVLVALMTSSVFIYSGIIVHIINLNLLVLALSAFCVMASREILKDIEDIQGDRLAGAVTLPIVLGIKKARFFSNVLICPAVFSIFLPFFLHTMGSVYLIFVCLVAFILFSSFFLIPQKAQKMIKLATLLVLLAFLSGSF